MIFKFTNNFRILELVQASQIELEQLELISTAKWVSYNGKKREKKSKSYFLNYKWLPGGFWHKILSLNKIGYSAKIQNTNELIRNITLEEFTDWVERLPLVDGYVPRWYQIRGAWLAVKYRISRGEFATSAGKSLILYLVSRFMLEKLVATDKKILIVVPSVMLVSQLAGDFSEYQTDDFIQVDKIHGGSKRTPDARVVVGGIDSLINYDSDFFTQFDAIIFDEAHKLSTAQYQKVIEYMHLNELKLIYAVSGTFYPESDANDFPAMSISGPILMRVGAKELMDEGSITPVKILIIRFIHSRQVSEQYYNHPDCQQINKRNHFELGYIRSQHARFAKIVQIASSLEYNQLLLFKSVSYCKAFKKYLEENFPNKTVMMIVGDVGNAERERVKQFTEANTNVIICASLGTMSTGVSLRNLGGMHLIEGGKSFIMIRQSIGRTLRTHASKSVAQIIDYVDVFKRYDDKWGGPKQKNISQNHSAHRKKIYDEQRFPWSEKEIIL